MTLDVYEAKRARVFSLIKPLREEAIEAVRELLDELQSDIEDLQSNNDALQEEAEGRSGDIADAVNELLDEVDRPVGALKPHLLPSPRSERALLALYDAIGRNP